MYMKSIVFAAALAIVAGAAAPAGAAGAKLVMGNEGDYPPYSIVTADGKLTGLEPELARALCARLQAECEIKAMDFAALVPSLISGKIDMIVSQLYPKPERLEQTDFTTPILYNPDGWVLPAAGPQAHNDAALAGKRIGVIKGAAYIPYVQRVAPSTKTVQYDGINPIWLDMKAGRLDGSFGSRLSWSIAMQGQAEANDWVILPIEYTAADDIKAEFSWAVQKGNKELLAKVNSALEALFADCTYTKIRKNFIEVSTSNREPKACE